MARDDLWSVTDRARWRAALDRYPAVIERQDVTSLRNLDRWYQEELPDVIAGREPRHITLRELEKVTQWKMARGVWRGRNLALVRGNDPERVIAASTEALAKAPHPTAPIAELAKLAGVGPATASAVMAAAEPGIHPFFDDLVANQIPQLGEVAYTVAYYARYATVLRERAAELGDAWTPVMVERALWAHAGGKAAAR